MALTANISFQNTEVIIFVAKIGKGEKQGVYEIIRNEKRGFWKVIK
jgi:hypothetical protein